MEYDDLLKNVKATLIKAATEGKNKGYALGIKQATEIVNKKVDEFKVSLLAELNNLLNDAGSAEENSSKETKNKEN